MKFNSITTTVKTAFSVTAAVLSAIAILAIYPESQRQKEIQQAKRSIAERKAQTGRRKAEAEVELQKMKTELMVTAITPIPEPQPKPTSELPTLPNPWELEGSEIIAPPPAAPSRQQTRWQLCLPVASEPVPTTQKVKKAKPAPATNYSKMSIRELKAIASKRKLRGYGNMSKAQLIKVLAG